MAGYHQNDPTGPHKALWSMICKTGRKFRLYEVSETYSQVSGGVTTKGKMIRRYDPEARELEGKPAQFSTLEECETYAKRWLIH